MATSYTSLLGLALPVTGELQGTWGTTVNDSITSLLDTAVAGTTTLSTDGDVTLSTTTGAANQARQAILLCSGARTAQRTITAPAQSKIYTVINATTGGFSVKLVGAGPTTGITIAPGESTLAAWNGSDFIKVSTFGGAGIFTDLTVSGNTTLGDAAGDTTTVSGPMTLSAGTANGVVYLNASKVATSGSALTFDGTNAATTGTSSATKFIPTGGAATGNGMYLSAANTLGWSTNGTKQLELDSAGNLGLGVTPSAWGAGSQALQNGGGAVFQYNNDRIFLGQNNYIDASFADKFIGNGYATRYRQYQGTHAFFVSTVSNSSGAGASASFTQALTLDASGNLLVGGTSQSGTANREAVFSANKFGLAIIDTTAQTTGVGGALNLGGNYRSAGDAQAFVRIEAAKENATDANYAYAMAFSTTPNGGTFTERARITSGGDLLVGTTSVPSPFTTPAITAFRTGSSHSFVAVGDAHTYDPVISWNKATTGDNRFVAFGTEGTWTERGAIDYNRAGGLVRYNTTSDYRAKDIIGPVQNPGATIDALKVYEGVMKGATQSRPMLIAHEAQAHAPYAVSGVKDEVNEDGTPKFQQMDVSSLVPLLLAEIQSLRARVAALEAQP